MKLGCEFGSGGAATDDCNMQLFGPQGFLLSVGSYAGIDQAPVKEFGVFRCFETERVLFDAGCAEIVGNAAYRDNERVVGNG